MRIRPDRPTPEQLTRLLAVVKAVAAWRGLNVPMAYLWLCAKTLGHTPIPWRLSADQCRALIEHRLVVS